MAVDLKIYSTEDPSSNKYYEVSYTIQMKTTSYHEILQWSPVMK